MQDISLHLLDIIENSIQAKAKNILLKIIIDKRKDLLVIEITDDGKGMDEETLKSAQQPFFTTKIHRPKKIGLGIPLFKQNAEHCDGFFSMNSEPAKGTSLKAVFGFSHIDRMPLGNVADTILTSISGHPEVDFKIYYKYLAGRENRSFTFNTKEIKQELEDIPINYPDVVKYVRQLLYEGFANVYEELK